MKIIKGLQISQIHPHSVVQSSAGGQRPLICFVSPRLSFFWCIRVFLIDWRRCASKPPCMPLYANSKLPFGGRPPYHTSKQQQQQYLSIQCIGCCCVLIGLLMLSGWPSKNTCSACYSDTGRFHHMVYEIIQNCGVAHCTTYLSRVASIALHVSKWLSAQWPSVDCLRELESISGRQITKSHRCSVAGSFARSWRPLLLFQICILIIVPVQTQCGAKTRFHLLFTLFIATSPFCALNKR